MIPLFLGRIGLTELLVVLLIVVLCFCGKKIPELMRGVGRGVKAFREGLEGTDEAVKAEPAAKTETAVKTETEVAKTETSVKTEAEGAKTEAEAGEASGRA